MSSPAPPDHPANKLSKTVSTEARQQLLKTPYTLPLEANIYQERLKEIRNNWKYGFIIQWCFLFKNFIKLTDHFDVDSFEEELLQINPPNFLTRFKAQLVYFLTGDKISESYIDETGEFEEALRDLIPEFLLERFQTDDELEMFEFFKLSLADQIEVYYRLIDLTNQKTAALRKFIDNRFENALEYTRPMLIHASDKKLSKEQYLILPDLRLYRQETQYKKLDLPRRRTDFENKFREPQQLVDHLDLKGPVISKFECLATNIYEFDAFASSLSKSSVLYKALKEHYDEVTENDIRRRKQQLARQRQIKMQSMMVHRKRSSRLEEKEKRKQEEDEKERLEQERLRREAHAIRAAKRAKLRGDGISLVESLRNSREERYKRKHSETLAPETASEQAAEPSTEPAVADAESNIGISSEMESLPEQSQEIVSNKGAETQTDELKPYSQPEAAFIQEATADPSTETLTKSNGEGIESLTQNSEVQVNPTTSASPLGQTIPETSV